MFPSQALLSLVFISLTAVHAVSIDPRTGERTLSSTTRINELGDVDIVEQDFAYVQSLLQGGLLGKRDGTSVGVTNSAVNYVAQVGVGTPPTDYRLLIDTGSANTWVNASKKYVETESSHDTGCTVKVNYGGGSFSGTECNDTVTLSPGLVVHQQSIGVAQRSHGLGPGDDGILGLGRTLATQSTVSCKKTVPTVMDNLISQGKISENVLGIYFIPSSQSSKGELTFGGYDTSVIVGPVHYVERNRDNNKLWSIDQSIDYGGNLVMDPTSGIVDTGSLFVYIAEVYDTPKNQIGFARTDYTYSESN